MRLRTKYCIITKYDECDNIVLSIVPSHAELLIMKVGKFVMPSCLVYVKIIVIRVLVAI